MLIVEVADSIRIGTRYIQLAGYIQSMCAESGFALTERHINFVLSDRGRELPEHDWSPDFIAEADAHSNCHQLLVFLKSPQAEFHQDKGEILYIDYHSSEEHPCPFPLETQKFLLDRYFKPGFVVCDPFMGTGTLGKEVVRRGGRFVGYEIDPTIFAVAKKTLQK